MTVRRARRIGYALAGGYVLLCARPLSYLVLLVRLDELREQQPEQFVPAVAREVVERVLAEEQAAYQAQLETVRLAAEARDDYSLDADVRPDDEMLADLRTDLAKAEGASHVAWRIRQALQPHVPS